MAVLPLYQKSILIIANITSSRGARELGTSFATGCASELKRRLDTGHSFGQLVSCNPLEQLQFREILRIDNADWDLVIIDHDEIVDPMALEQVENFHRELVLMNRHRI